MKTIFTFLLCLGVLGSRAQNNSFPTSGNAVMGGLNYLNLGSRVYLQYAGSSASSWTRGMMSQGVYWDKGNSVWNVQGSSAASDFSMIRFENVGNVGFYTRASTGQAYTLTNSELESYRRLTILNNGNIGIGITTPTEKLAVNGNIRAKEVKVETANWPDYVFEENYRLSSLTDLESYIKANKHLPNIPNQKQVEEEGISLGEMNRKLLEKVEELTLHLIEKEKEIQRMEEVQSFILERLSKIEH